MSIFRLTTQEAKEQLEVLEDKLARINQECSRAAVPWETTRLLDEYRDIVEREKKSLIVNYPLAVTLSPKAQALKV